MPRYWNQAIATRDVRLLPIPSADGWLPQTNQPYLVRQYDRYGLSELDPAVRATPGVPQLPSYGPGTNQPFQDLKRLQYLYPFLALNNIKPITLPTETFAVQTNQP